MTSYTAESPIIRGRPAFGLTHRGNAGSGRGELREDRRHVLEARAAIGSDGRGALLDRERDDLAVVVPIIVARPPVEGEREHEREIGRPADAFDGRRGLQLAEHRLQHEQVGAARGQCLGLLGIRLGRLVVRQQAERLAQLPRRAERAGHQHVGADRLARQLGRAPVDLGRLICERAVGESDARASERAGEHDVDPASANPRCSSRMRSGSENTHSSGATPIGRPMR